MSFDFVEAYRMMYLIRHTEEEIARRYHPADLMRCPTHLSIGQEAASVGVLMALDPDDHAYSSHRSHAHFLGKGGSLNAMIAELHGKVTGSTGGWGGSMHLIDEACGFLGANPGVAQTISLAVGSALAFKLDGSKQVAVAFFGDAAVEAGIFWEAANFAALHKLPLMLICENNTYATATPISARQPDTPITDRVKGFMWSRRVEDANIVDVWKAAQECRDSHPGFLEIGTYRHREHVGPNYDWELGYRTEEEVKHHISIDPINAVRSNVSEQDVSKIEQIIQGQVLVAFDEASAAPWPESIKS